MNSIQILYDSTDHDKIFSFLKAIFKGTTQDVSVTQIIPDEYVDISWTEGVAPSTVAIDLTAEVPGAVIETESTTGIDLKSRYFNKAQLY